MSNKLFLIGINQYDSKPLNSCVKDVQDFKQILLDKYDFDQTDVYEIYDKNATLKNIYDALTKYVKTLKDGDNLIIYHSGHGSYNEDLEMGYWVPIDGVKGESSYLSNQTLVTTLDKMKAHHIFLITDCCFSASLLRTSNIKSTSEYDKKKSRWALVSSFRDALDSNVGENSLFGETIVNFLNDQTTDFKVSNLIEHVKNTYEINQFQTPQGHPMAIQGHEGGEFVFHIKTEIDNRQFKGYADFLNILKLYKRTSKFNEKIKIEDKSNKIGYILYEEQDKVQKKIYYYLYLYEGVNLTQTEKHFKDNFKIGSDKLILFLPKERDQTHYEIRKKNVELKFKPLNIFYIDEFILNECTPYVSRDNDIRFLNISNFVLPSYIATSNELNLDIYIQNWFENIETPILVIKGAGGIGKTTFAQYIADKIFSTNKNGTTLFIDSAQIKDKLLKRSDDPQNINLYDFYEALCEITSEDKLNKELFRLNVDAGNILIIIDGLDEVISKIPDFNISMFIKSINETIENIRGGKVIITCRTFFWENINIEDRFPIIELLPFNDDQTKSFFEKSFTNNDHKQKKALALAKDFKHDGDNSGTFHPYVLDIIRSIIVDRQSIVTDLSEFSSSYLKPKIKNDYIIFRICDRERKRVGQISIDEQISFFIYMALYKRGVINKDSFNNEIFEALKKHIDITNVEAFKSHPFLYHRDRNIIFKYDFLLDYFRGIYLSNYFVFSPKDASINIETFNLIKESCWWSSTMIMDIVNRFDNWSEYDILYASEIIKKILLNDFASLKDIKIVVSNYFNVCLALNQKMNNNDILSNTQLLLGLFESNKKVTKLSIINFSASVKFDFSGLILDECHFDSYEYFWKCKFDSKTIFNKCTFLNIPFNKSDNIIPLENFRDCLKDKYMEDVFKLNEENNFNNIERAKIFLDAFFHLFYTNGYLGRQWEDKVILPRFAGVDKSQYGYKNILKILKEKNVLIVNKELNRNKIEINDSYKEDVSRFVKDGTMSIIINELIIRISKL